MRLGRAPRGVAEVWWRWGVVRITIGAMDVGGVAIVRRGFTFLMFLSRVVCFAALTLRAMRWGVGFFDNGNTFPVGVRVTVVIMCDAKGLQEVFGRRIVSYYRN